MLTYENFFLIILISILGPIVGLLLLIFYNLLEKQVYVLEIEKKQIVLEKELETSRYIQLNQQIQPHFLFNALNSMLSLLRLKRYDGLTDAFEHMVLYLRSKYKETGPLYTLEEEITYTKHFIAIQQLRFGNRLSVRWEVDPRANKVLIIPYLIQTLVENACKHGVEMIETEACIFIAIRIGDENEITLTVSDNGPGFSSPPLLSNRGGIGLKNVQRRLELLFDSQTEIKFETIGQGEGAKITVVWPLTYEEEKKDENSYS